MWRTRQTLFFSYQLTEKGRSWVEKCKEKISLGVLIQGEWRWQSYYHGHRGRDDGAYGTYRTSLMLDKGWCWSHWGWICSCTLSRYSEFKSLFGQWPQRANDSRGTGNRWSITLEWLYFSFFCRLSILQCAGRCTRMENNYVLDYSPFISIFHFDNNENVRRFVACLSILLHRQMYGDRETISWFSPLLIIFSFGWW